MKAKQLLLSLVLFCAGAQFFFVSAQASWENGSAETPGQTQNRSGGGNFMNTDLPLRRIALFSSGVSYFEHSGAITGEAAILLPFDAEAVNDALKSLVINDPGSAPPSVRYASENTLARTLKSLKIDLSLSPGIGAILYSQIGAEVEVFSPSSIKGRIIGVEWRDRNVSPKEAAAQEAWLSLFTERGIRAIALDNIASFRFTDEAINRDLTRALDLFLASRDNEARNLLINLGGNQNRNVSVSYVIPAPVWKVSYRLDLSGAEPFLQGWAIVDNDSDTDWKDVELSLVIGRPVSFIQNLYPPYRLSRPVLPLSIAGIAESRTYESGYGNVPREPSRASAKMALMEDMAAEESYEMEMMAPAQSLARPAPSVAGGTIQTAAGSAAGDQFEFTLKNPVSLERRQSAMLPLVEGAVKAEKILVFSGTRALSGASINPAISAELTNTSGMKLPAGPITVYDGGIYSGDALIEFFPENEKRLISYAEDLSVTGNLTSKGTRYLTGVTISGGVMTISRRQTHEKEYTIRNASAETKKLIVEHPITAGAELAEPKIAEDRTANLYRFTRSLGPKEVLVFNVREETPVSQHMTLSGLQSDALLSYATSREIPENVRAALARAIELKTAADDAAAAATNLENQRSRLIGEQDRIRNNLEAAGNTSPQGQEYLRRLGNLDNSIDSLNNQIDAAYKAAEEAMKTYENYLAGLSI